MSLVVYVFPSIPIQNLLSLHQMLTYVVGSVGKSPKSSWSLQCAVCPECSCAHRAFWPDKWAFELEKLTRMDFPARLWFFHALHQSPSVVFLHQENNLRMISALSTKLLLNCPRQRFLNLGIINILGQIILWWGCLMKSRIFNSISLTTRYQ